MKILYAMLGAPGAGKTTFIHNASMALFNDDRLKYYVVSPDNIRLQVQSPKQKPSGDFKISMDAERFVWDIVHSILDRKVQKGETIFIDATHSRNSALSVYKKYSDQGYRIHLIDFRDVPLADVLKQNEARDPIKHVPADRVETIYERIKVMDIPNWIEVIKPEDFVDHFNKFKFDFSHFKSLNFIGDIHGCNDELNNLLDSLSIDPNTPQPKDVANIFIGDYFDRGPKIVETFRTLQKLQENSYCLLLMGNHEEPLRFMKDMYNVAWQAWTEWFNDLVDPETPNICGVNFQTEFSKYRGQSWKKVDALIEDLRQYPNCYDNFSAFFRKYRLSPDVSKLIKSTSRRAMKIFILSDVTYQEISSFYKKLAQICYVQYGTETILATHGGLPSLPTKLTPGADIIRGVGSYEEAQECDEAFAKAHPNAISIHGHRNTTNIPLCNTASTFNINGDVDLGLRSISIHANLVIETNEIKPTDATLEFNRERQIHSAKRFGAKKLSAEEENQGLLKLFQDHTHVDVKKLPNDIVAVNFSRKAFEKGVWDDITLKARGLFLDNSPTEARPADVTEEKQPQITEPYVIARGYEKFFNIGEKHGLDIKDIRQLAFPVTAYEKANGYLGLLSVDTRGFFPQWFISSKSTTEGDFAIKFRDMITPMLTEDLKQFMLESNTTLVFEVIDPEWDPHIEEYSHPQLVILDAIRNEINFEKLPYESLEKFRECFRPPENYGIEIRIKKLLGIFEKFNDFNTFRQDLNNNPRMNIVGIEGIVFEDSSDPQVMFKLKTKWYSFWKRQRSQKDRVVNRILKNKGPLTKSDLIRFRERLHDATDIKVFEALVKVCQDDHKFMITASVPETRRRILQEIRDGIQKDKETTNV